MENRETKETTMWNCGGYVLEGDGHSGWLSFMWWGEENHGMEVFWGRTWIEHDTLIMGPWKVGDYPKDGQPKTPEELDSFLESLPKWDKTKYYIKMGDIGMSPLMDCHTGEPVSDNIADEIMPKLGFTKAPVIEA